MKPYRYPQNYVTTQTLPHGDVIFPTSGHRDSCVAMKFLGIQLEELLKTQTTLWSELNIKAPTY